ncbi:hypothetical protein GUJ93_ZPchr0002g25991 [Zizania palustris]|uniref:Uncharacterized protein n=1 Tax=Zizania palustris TaxID=103762 RepID=A0A8J5SFK3_ZIZPA|nr:hypothetical protein GUJ93_ZPchr0002g25991 [Zizania palustris]
MMFRVSGLGRAGAGRGRMRRRKMAVARLGDGADAPRRRRRSVLCWLMIPRLLLLRSRRALARLTACYAEMVRRLVAEAAALEPPKARGAPVAPAPARAAVVPAAVARTVLRCDSHRYIR